MLPFLDTNVLLCSISRNPDESFKRARAEALLDEESGALSIQVLQEFYLQATRNRTSWSAPRHFISASASPRLTAATSSVFRVSERSRFECELPSPTQWFRADCDAAWLTYIKQKARW